MCCHEDGGPRRGRFAENLQRLPIIGAIIHHYYPSVATEEKFKRGPPALCFRLHLDEPAKLFDTGAEFLAHGLKERKRAG
jgi:hypothetical protein